MDKSAPFSLALGTKPQAKVVVDRSDGGNSLTTTLLLQQQLFKINSITKEQHTDVPKLRLVPFRDSAKQIKCLLQNNYLEKILEKNLEKI